MKNQFNLVWPRSFIVKTENVFKELLMHLVRSIQIFMSLIVVIFVSCLSSVWGATPNSGSTGADGPFNPSTSVTLTMPPDGVFNFTTVNIPSGVVVKFQRNATNTPVIILATGNVVIAGAIDIRGGDSPSIRNPANIGDSGQPGRGGPGGFDGGAGGMPKSQMRGGNGLGPGGGGGGNTFTSCCIQGGGGGGNGSVGDNSTAWGTALFTGIGGAAYGSGSIVPLVGGSGGGGGSGALNADTAYGSGGGGGGGAILIVSGGDINVVGQIVSVGGNSGTSACSAIINNVFNLGPCSGTGGGGAGGTVVLVAASLSGNLANLALGGGVRGTSNADGRANGGSGGTGRRITSILTGNFTYMSNMPSLTISSVAGIAAPLSPTGIGDITLPLGSPSTAQVMITTTNVPPGSTVQLTVSPERGAPVTTTSSPLTGTQASATATANIEIPIGNSTLLATASYTVTVAMGEALSVYAQGERVERIELSASMGGTSTTRLVTVSGKQFNAPALALTMLGTGS